MVESIDMLKLTWSICVCVCCSKMRLPAFLVDLMYRFNIMDIVRPAVMKIMNLVVGEAVRDLNQLERMKSPRVFKTHLPLYLLHPELLETSKVYNLKFYF